MRALIQRVTQTQVHVDGVQVGACENGILVLVCAMQDDTDDAPAKLAAKIAKLRIFKDVDGRMNRSLLDAQGEALIVSQFTLAADTARGNRPGFSAAAPPEQGDRLYQMVVNAMRDLGITTSTGQFGADMAVSLVNDGPVTIWIDTAA